MKYLLILIPSLFFLLLVLPINAYAQEEIIISPAVSITYTPTPSIQSYSLPYPGILPDNPLYFVKTFRDRIISFMISDALKKAEFDILQADKRMNAAYYLLDKRIGKEELAITTISKAENYYEEAIARIREAKQEGRDIRGAIKHLQRAREYYLSLFPKMKKKISPSFQSGFAYVTKRMELFEKDVNELSL
ncbi:MAG: hypothetical protein HYT10_01780 [Candidatus Levybacteria bacterium]|nr:hypothetical protein [Candidatus Levybacteria bacterium]